MFETGGKFPRESFIHFYVHLEYPFNALQVYHVSNGNKCAKDRARSFEEFIERSIDSHNELLDDEKEELKDRIISKFKSNGIVVYNDNDPEYAKEVYKKINNGFPHDDEYLNDNNTIMEMAYGRTQYYKIMNSIKNITNPSAIGLTNSEWIYLNDNIRTKGNDFLKEKFTGMFSLSNFYTKDSLIIDVYDVMKNIEDGKRIVTSLILDLAASYRLPTVLWHIKMMECQNNPSMIESMKEFFAEYGYMYFPDIFNKNLVIPDKEFVVYFKTLKAYNESLTPLDVFAMMDQPDYTNLKNSLANLTTYMEKEWIDEYNKFAIDMDYYPDKDSEFGKFIYSDDFFGMMTLGEQMYNNLIAAMSSEPVANKTPEVPEPEDVVDNVTDLKHETSYFKNSSEIFPGNFIGNDVLKYYNINKVEDFGRFSRNFFPKLYGDIFGPIQMELLSYKMRDASVNFLTDESYKMRLLNDNPKNIRIQELYGSGIITQGLYSVLHECNVKFVSDIDGLMIDYVNITVGMVNELKEIADKYYLRVYTTDEFVERVISSEGLGIPVTHLLKYFKDDSNIMEENADYINMLKGKNPVLFISDLFKITFKEFIVMGKNHPFVKNILIRLQKEIPKLNYRLALTVQTNSDVSYPKEINDSKGFFKDLDIDRNDDGVIDRKELEDFVLKKMGLFDIDTIEIEDDKDPSEVINLITDILWKMPEFGSALFDQENSSESFAYARKVIIDNKKNIMHTLKDILFSKEQFGYVLIMMLIQYTLACADSDSIDPYK